MQVFRNKIAIAAIFILLVIAVAFYCVSFSVSLVKATAPDPAQIQQALLDNTNGVDDMQEEVTYSYVVKLSLKDITKHGPAYYAKLVKKFVTKNKELVDTPEEFKENLEDFLDNIGELNPKEPGTNGKFVLDFHI